MTFEPDRLPARDTPESAALLDRLDLIEIARELEGVAERHPEERPIINRAQRLLSRQGATLTDIAATLRGSGTVGELLR